MPGSVELLVWSGEKSKYIGRSVDALIKGGNVGHAAIKVTIPKNELDEETSLALKNNKIPFTSTLQNVSSFNDDGSVASTQAIPSYEIYFSFWADENAAASLLSGMGKSFSTLQEDRKAEREQRKYGITEKTKEHYGEDIQQAYTKKGQSIVDRLLQKETNKDVFSGINIISGPISTKIFDHTPELIQSVFAFEKKKPGHIIDTDEQKNEQKNILDLFEECKKENEFGKKIQLMSKCIQATKRYLMGLEENLSPEDEDRKEYDKLYSTLNADIMEIEKFNKSYRKNDTEAHGINPDYSILMPTGENGINVNGVIKGMIDMAQKEYVFTGWNCASTALHVLLEGLPEALKIGSLKKHIKELDINSDNVAIYTPQKVMKLGAKIQRKIIELKSESAIKEIAKSKIHPEVVNESDLKDNAKLLSEKNILMNLKKPKNTKLRKLDYLSPKINLNHLEDNGMLFTDIEMEAIIKEFKENPEWKRHNYHFNSPKEGGYSKAAIIRLDDDPNHPGVPQCFAIYQGKKKGKLLGEGGSGKVKIMEKLPNGPRYALKISKEATENEIKNLVKAGMSPGGFKQESDGEKEAHWLIGMELAPGTDVLKQFIRPHQIHLTDYSDRSSFRDVYKEGEGGYAKDENGKYIIEAKLPNILYLDIEGSEPVCRIRVENEDGQFKIDTISLESLSSDDKETIIAMVKAVKNGDVAQKIDHALHDRIFNITRRAGYDEFVVHNPDLNLLASVATGMVSALKKLHNIGLVHNDIKSEQFIADPQTHTVRLIDLGSAISKKEKIIKVNEGITISYAPPEFILKQAEKKYEAVDAIREAFEAMKSDTGFMAFIEKHNITTSADLIKLNNKLKDIKLENELPGSIGKNNLEKHNIEFSDIPVIKDFYKKFNLQQNKLFSERRESAFDVANSKAADVYMLGISLAQLFNLTKHANPKEYYEQNYGQKLDDKKYDLNAFKIGGTCYDVYAIKSKKEFEQNPITKDQPERTEKIEELRQYVEEKMLAFNPKDRPKMKDVKIFMKKFAKDFPPPTSFPVVILEVNHFLKLTENEKKSLIKELENTQVTMLAKTDNTKKQIYTVQAFLQNNGISLRKEYYTQRTTNVDKIKQKISVQDSATKVFAFALPSESKELAAYKESIQHEKQEEKTAFATQPDIKQPLPSNVVLPPVADIPVDEKPNTPEVVNGSDLKENGKLLSDANIIRVKEFFKDNPDVRRIGKKAKLKKMSDEEGKVTESTNGFAVLKFENPTTKKETLFAVYNKLGQGGYGKVKRMQNLDTGEWFALKIMDIRKEKDALNEIKNLTQAGLTAGSFVRKEKNDKGQLKEQILIAMNLATGVDLDVVVKNTENTVYSSNTLLHIAAETAKKLAELHDHQLLHRDIKPANIMYDDKTGKVAIIDLGSAMHEVLMPKQGVQKIGASIPYLAPELIEREAINWHAVFSIKNENYRKDPALLAEYKSKLKESFPFSKQSDTYAYGIAMAEAMGLIKLADPKDIVPELKNEKKYNVLTEKFYTVIGPEEAPCGLILMDPLPTTFNRKDLPDDYAFNHAIIMDKAGECYYFDARNDKYEKIISDAAKEIKKSLGSLIEDTDFSQKPTVKNLSFDQFKKIAEITKHPRLQTGLVDLKSEERKEIIEYSKLITHRDPKKRPPLMEAEKFFEAHYHSLQARDDVHSNVVLPPVADIPVEAIYRYEALYQQYLLELAIEAAKVPVPSDKRRFDPQGHIIVEVSSEDALKKVFEREDPNDISIDKEKIANILRVDPMKLTFCNIDSRGDDSLKEAYKVWLLENVPSENKDLLIAAGDALLQSNESASIIPLQEEMEMHMRLKARVLRDALGELSYNNEDTWRTIHNTAAKEINHQVQMAFQAALLESYKDNKIDYRILNQQLDKSRKEISRFCADTLMVACEENIGDFYKKFEQVKDEITKKSFESHTATDQDYFHTDVRNQTALRIEGTDHTAHNKRINKGGDFQSFRAFHRNIYAKDVQDGQLTIQQLPQIRAEVRIPSIAIFKNISKRDAILDVREKLKVNHHKMNELLGGEYKEPFVYNLLTSLPNILIAKTLDAPNQQRASAEAILKGAHLFNKDQLQKTPPSSLWYIQNIPVNQHGNELNHQSRDEVTAEATLMAEIAMLSTLVNYIQNDNLKNYYNNIYNSLKKDYEVFVKNISNSEEVGFFKDSVNGKNAIKTLNSMKKDKPNVLSGSDSKLASAPLADLAAQVLLKAMVTNQHWNKQYGMLIQALSAFTQKATMMGCKSANERFQAVSNRCDLLLSMQGRKETLAGDEAAFVKTLTDYIKGSVSLNEVQLALDKSYNLYNLYGASTTVSHNDQGAPSKVIASENKTGKVSEFNTNIAESWLDRLIQKNAGNMQAHKGDQADQLKDSASRRFAWLALGLKNDTLIGDYEIEDVNTKEKMPTKLASMKVESILGKKGAAELYNGVSTTDSKTARKAFIDKLGNVLQDMDKNFPLPKEGEEDPRKIDPGKHAITMESLLGKEGIALYHKAIEEERNSKEFRDAVFLASAKHYDGPKWAERLILWVAGPSSSGKSFAAEEVIKKVDKEVMEKTDLTNVDGNTVVSVDGGIEREISQMRALLLQVALKKGHTGIKDLHENTKLVMSKQVKRAALASDNNLSLVIPATFASPFADIGKKIKNFSKLKNTKMVFSEVVAEEGKEKEFERTVARMGDARAWNSDFSQERTIKINNRSIGSESKIHQKLFFKTGQEKSRKAGKYYRKNVADPIYMKIINDLIFVRKDDSGKWVECQKNDRGPAIKLSARDFEEYKKDKTTHLDLSEWLNELKKDNKMAPLLIELVSKKDMDLIEIENQGLKEYLTDALKKMEIENSEENRANTLEVITDLHNQPYLWKEVKEQGKAKDVSKYFNFFEKYFEFMNEMDEEKSKQLWKGMYTTFLSKSSTERLEMTDDARDDCEQFNSGKFDKKTAADVLQEVVEKGIHTSDMFETAFKMTVDPILKNELTIAKLDKVRSDWLLNENMDRILNEVSRSTKKGKGPSKTIESISNLIQLTLKNENMSIDKKIETITTELLAKYERYNNPKKSKKVAYVLMKMKDNYPDLVAKNLEQDIDQLNKKNIGMTIDKINSKFKDNTFSYADYMSLQSLLTDKRSRKLIFGDEKFEKSYANAYSKSIDFIANSLTAEALDLYKNLDTRDFLEKGFETKDTSYSKLVKYNNDLNDIIVNSILGASSMKGRTLTLEHWVRIAHKCWTTNPPNLFSAMAIINAVEQANVSRLKYTIAGLPEESRIMLEEMKEFFSPLNNYKNYNKYMEKNANAIPSIEIPSKHFFMLHEIKSAGVSPENIAKSYQILTDLRNQIDNNKTILLREPGNATLFDPALLGSEEANALILSGKASKIDAARYLISKGLENEEMVNLKPTEIMRNYAERIYKYKSTEPLFTIQPKIIDPAVALANTKNVYEIGLMLLKKNRSEFQFNISDDKNVNLVDYAKWIYANKKPDVNEKDPMDEPPMMKLMAATYLMLNEPTYFNPDLTGQLDKDEEAINRSKNNIDLTKVWVGELNEAEKKVYKNFLNSPDLPIMANSHLPSELKIALLEAINPKNLTTMDPAYFLIETFKAEKTLETKKNTTATAKKDSIAVEIATDAGALDTAKKELKIELANPDLELLKLNPSELLFEVSNDKNNKKVNLADYAKWIYENKNPAENEKNPMNEPAMMKLMAATYLMLNEPTFFNPDLTGQPDSDEATLNKASNHIDLTKGFLNGLNETEKNKYKEWLASPDPANKGDTFQETIITNFHLPSELKVALLEASGPKNLKATDPTYVLIETLKDKKTLEKKKDSIALEMAFDTTKLKEAKEALEDIKPSKQLQEPLMLMRTAKVHPVINEIYKTEKTFRDNLKVFFEGITTIIPMLPQEDQNKLREFMKAYENMKLNPLSDPAPYSFREKVDEIFKIFKSSDEGFTEQNKHLSFTEQGKHLISATREMYALNKLLGEIRVMHKDVYDLALGDFNKKTGSNYDNFEAVTIMPAQRMPRYRLLLEGLEQFDTDQANKKNINPYLSRARELATQANTEMVASPPVNDLRDLIVDTLKKLVTLKQGVEVKSTVSPDNKDKIQQIKLIDAAINSIRKISYDASNNEEMGQKLEQLLSAIKQIKDVSRMQRQESQRIAINITSSFDTEIKNIEKLITTSKLYIKQQSSAQKIAPEPSSQKIAPEPSSQKIAPEPSFKSEPVVEKLDDKKVQQPDTTQTPPPILDHDPKERLTRTITATYAKCEELGQILNKQGNVDPVVLNNLNKDKEELQEMMTLVKSVDYVDYIGSTDKPPFVTELKRIRDGVIDKIQLGKKSGEVKESVLKKEIKIVDEIKDLDTIQKMITGYEVIINGLTATILSKKGRIELIEAKNNCNKLHKQLKTLALVEKTNDSKRNEIAGYLTRLNKLIKDKKGEIVTHLHDPKHQDITDNEIKEILNDSASQTSSDIHEAKAIISINPDYSEDSESPNDPTTLHHYRENEYQIGEHAVKTIAINCDHGNRREVTFNKESIKYLTGEIHIRNQDSKLKLLYEVVDQIEKFRECYAHGVIRKLSEQQPRLTPEEINQRVTEQLANLQINIHGFPRAIAKKMATYCATQGYRYTTKVVSSKGEYFNPSAKDIQKLANMLEKQKEQNIIDLPKQYQPVHDPLLKHPGNADAFLNGHAHHYTLHNHVEHIPHVNKIDHVSESIFPQRTGNTVQFYSDAYDNDKKNSGAFNDIFNSMNNAKESILITGWTLSPTEQFKFGGDSNITMTLPHLFAKKALAGTDIIVLAWENIAPDFKNDTTTFVQSVKDEIKILAKQESNNTSSPYYNDPKGAEQMMLDKINIKFSKSHLGYSDHAKMVIVDAKELYMGGLDLTKGRSQIETWHDCHCRIKGPSVTDGIKLFSNRFKTCNSDPEKDQHANEILENAETKSNILASSLAGSNTKEPTMQLLTAVRKEFYDPDNKENITWEKDSHVKEIMNSQVQAIKAAKNFIYMENQFFTGPHTDKLGELIKGHNLVILELYEKITESIRAGTPFHFYCQLPFRPEGKSDDVVVNLILRKQWKTMEWFIESIKKEIDDYNKIPKNATNQKEVGDYLTFTNLGFHDPNKKTEKGFEMKYTHSKLMIIDDNVAFIGSNNCNERSNKGNRDHEVCMRIENYGEQIKEYRQNLMKQHFGQDCMSTIINNDPQDKTFVDKIKMQLNQNLVNLRELHKQNNNPAQTQKAPMPATATPWGNTHTTRLELAKRPPHVPKRTTKALRAAMSANEFLYKFVR
jgi:serine/threonine protein kinase/phosphatidylserine/phosphatidylglycerophosphate/cardiolipin synthase-like enzyme